MLHLIHDFVNSLATHLWDNLIANVDATTGSLSPTGLASVRLQENSRGLRLYGFALDDHGINRDADLLGYGLLQGLLRRRVLHELVRIRHLQLFTSLHGLLCCGSNGRSSRLRVKPHRGDNDGCGRGGAWSGGSVCDGLCGRASCSDCRGRIGPRGSCQCSCGGHCGGGRCDGLAVLVALNDSSSRNRALFHLCGVAVARLAAAARRQLRPRSQLLGRATGHGLTSTPVLPVIEGTIDGACIARVAELLLLGLAMTSLAMWSTGLVSYEAKPDSIPLSAGRGTGSPLVPVLPGAVHGAAAQHGTGRGLRGVPHAILSAMCGWNLST
mmetsp:Transcript_34639/g.48317  ORF Transcript_34639/g.48317 Transcript_34639/m.48317 type:complete len:326 (-) Transcript_34639:406-1383(-)